jgi:hypothetical protein
MHTVMRIAAIAAAVVALAQPAAAAPVRATIRIEGPGATVLPQVTRTTDTRGITDTMGVSHPFAASAATLTADAAEAAGLHYTCSWFAPDCLFDFGPLPANVYWAFVLDDKVAQTGAGQTPLAADSSDRVAWVPWDFSSPLHMLELGVDADAVPVGGSVGVTVSDYDLQTGTAQPAVGASVVYGTQTAAVGASGRVSFSALAPGNAQVSATAPAAIRSGSSTVCAYAADPGVCSLPVPPASAPPGPASAAPADTVPPSSRVTWPRLFGRVRTVTRIEGLAAQDRSDVARVEYALARRVGTLCRFRGSGGGFGAAVPCSDRVWLPARGTIFWAAALHRPLAPGRYRVFSRATDGAGNVETTLVSGASNGSFTVVR